MLEEFYVIQNMHFLTFDIYLETEVDNVKLDRNFTLRGNTVRIFAPTDSTTQNFEGIAIIV